MSRKQKRKRKTLQQLTFRDAFMFAAVMLDEEIAKGVLERILNVEIDRVKIDTEKSFVYHPQYKGVRLDVYVKDGQGTHYDVEMQVANKQIFKRSRYYHSQIDMDLLETGVDYEQLPDTYVIFICDYDPIGLGKYRYTRCQTLVEDGTYEYQDGSHTIFLSTKGQNDDEVPESLVKFLKYVGAELGTSTKDYEDEFIARLQESVTRVKESKEMGARYMTLQELLKDEREEGRQEGFEDGERVGERKARQQSIFDILETKGCVSEELKVKICEIEDTGILSELILRAVQLQNVQSFEAELETIKK